MAARRTRNPTEEATVTDPELDLDEGTTVDDDAPVDEEPKRARAKPRPKPDKHPPNSRTTGLGDKGDDVALAQRVLGAEPDGTFGPITEKHVKRYQKMRGYPPTGVLRRDGKEWKTIILDAPEGA